MQVDFSDFFFPAHLILLVSEKEAIYKIRVIHDGSNTINCCLNSLQEMSGSMYFSIYGEQRDTMKKALTAPVVSVVRAVHGVFI